MSYCQLNVSQCEITEQNTRFVVNVYNGLSRSVDRYVRFPVSDVVSSYRVIDSNGKFFGVVGVLFIKGLHFVALEALSFRPRNFPFRTP